jgi:hypothetical protein
MLSIINRISNKTMCTNGRHPQACHNWHSFVKMVSKKQAESRDSTVSNMGTWRRCLILNNHWNIAKYSTQGMNSSTSMVHIARIKKRQVSTRGKGIPSRTRRIRKIRIGHIFVHLISFLMTNIHMTIILKVAANLKVEGDLEVDISRDREHNKPSNLFSIHRLSKVNNTHVGNQNEQ